MTKMSLADVALDVSIEAFVIQQVVNPLPPTPLRRELLIQNGKLLRMTMQPERLAGVSKKMKKRRAKRAKEIGQQKKKVDELADKCFKDYLRQVNASLTNAEYREWRAKFDSGMRDRKDEMKKQVFEAGIAALAGPPKKRPRGK